MGAGGERGGCCPACQDMSASLTRWLAGRRRWFLVDGLVEHSEGERGRMEVGDGRRMVYRGDVLVA